MSQSFHLFNLQKLDLQIDRATQRLQEIHQIIEKDARIETATRSHEELVQELRHAQQKLKTLEQDVDARRVKLEQSEANLYSGRVKIPKELQDLQNEVAAIKRNLNILEDQQLEAMLVVEELTAQVDQSRHNLEATIARVSEDHSGLMGEKNQLSADLERLQIERAAIASQITAANLSRYDLLRKSKRGIAVVSLVENACTACGSTLTPGESQAARSPTNIVTCPSCGRIVYSG